MGFMDILKNVIKESMAETNLPVQGQNMPMQGQKKGSYQTDPRFLHNRLREIRAQSHLTQEDVAQKVGVTHQAISEMERGRFCPNEKLALRICAAVGKSCEEVFY